MSAPWKILGAVDPRSLVDARLQLHHAAQVVSAVGQTFLDPQPDDSHPNLGWVDAVGMLVGRPAHGVRAALQPTHLRLALLDGEDRAIESLDLPGKGLEAGWAWLADALEQAGLTLPEGGVRRTPYDLPEHPVATGGAFVRKPPGAFEELSRWFANGHHALAEAAGKPEGASPVRIWPHHFDVGTLVTAASHPDGSLAKSIGLGLSPGDDSYPEPYWYVSPWPYPDFSPLPDLGPDGRWHRKGFTAAVLLGSELVSGPAERQADRLHAFLHAALRASHQILAR